MIHLRVVGERSVWKYGRQEIRGGLEALYFLELQNVTRDRGCLIKSVHVLTKACLSGCMFSAEETQGGERIRWLTLPENWQCWASQARPCIWEDRSPMQQPVVAEN